MLAEHFQTLRELSSYTVWLQCVAAIISSNGWQYCVVQWLAVLFGAMVGSSVCCSVWQGGDSGGMFVPGRLFLPSLDSYQLYEAAPSPSPLSHTTPTTPTAVGDQHLPINQMSSIIKHILNSTSR